MILSWRPDNGMRRVRLSVWLLSSLAVLLMGAWVVLFARLLETDRQLGSRVREDAIWAVFQADRQTAALTHVAREILTAGAVQRHDELMLAYDILYSRAQLLERGAFAVDLSIETEIGKASAAHTRQIIDLAPEFDRLDPGGKGYLSDLEVLLPRLSALQAGISELSLAANNSINNSRVAERALRKTIHDQLGWSAALLVLAFFGIGVLLVFQLRQLQRAHQRMARLRLLSSQQAIKARAASAVKSTFLATMSHEIRTPLNAIIGSAELLGSAGLGAQERRHLDTIQSAGRLLLDVINDILDYSKLDGRALELSPEPVDLPEIARTIHSAFATRATARGLGLIMHFAPERIHTDPGRLRQVIVNLVGNALKFTRAGEVSVTASLVPPGRLRVEVRDTGIGIKPEDQSRLFRDFEQLDGSYARAYGGTGLGLAICKRIVEGMGGQIGVVSAQGAGSTFWFEIPVEHMGAAMPESAPAPKAPLAPAPQASLDVLVVDDSPINRQVLSDQLVRLGHRPVTAETGYDALDRLAADHFDCVLMDMQMPGISGPDTTLALRASGHLLPVIGVTANASTDDRRICKAAGMDGFLPKPVTLARLAEALAEAVPLHDAPPSAPSPQAPEANPQLEDLLASFGARMVQGFLTQFEGSLPETDDELQRALVSGDASGLDAALHTLKGAALTLGLRQTGQRAQALRPPAMVDAAACADLMRLAHEELSHLRHQFGSRIDPEDRPDTKGAGQALEQGPTSLVLASGASSGAAHGSL